MGVKKTSKFKTLILLGLTLVMSLTQTNVHANVKAEPKTNEAIIIELLKKSENEIEIVDFEDRVEANVITDFKFSDENWEDILSNDKKLKIDFPDFVDILDDEIEILNPEEHLSFEHEINVKESMIDVKEHSLKLDFLELEEKVNDFSLKFKISILKNAFDETQLNEEIYPIVSIFNEELLDLLRVSKEAVEEVDEDEPLVNDETDDGELNEGESEDDEDQESVPETNKALLTGDISLAFKDEPNVSLEVKNGSVISDKNPISMQNYEDTNYEINITSGDTNKFLVNYKVKIDAATLEGLSEAQLKEGVMFKYLKEDQQAPFEYEYEFPQIMRFEAATEGPVTPSEKYDGLISTTLERVDGGDYIKLVVEEIKESVDDYEIYKFQSAIGAKLGEYIDHALNEGKTVEEIKADLVEGVDLLEDDYNIKNYSFVKKPLAELESEIDYHLESKNFMNSNKDIDVTFPVFPKGGFNHQLNTSENNFEIVDDGFIYRWDGVLNTNRNDTLEKINFVFTNPTFIKNTNDWTITNKIKLDYFEVLNDGTPNPKDELTDVFEESDNRFSHALENDNLAVKYHIERHYINAEFKDEIEGKQTSRATVSLNNGRHSQSADNSHEFPKSIIITGNTLDESNPTNLLWNVNYNNNGLIRRGGDGFDFIFKKENLEKDNFELQRFNGVDYIKEKGIDPLEEMEHSIHVKGKSLKDDGRFDLTEADGVFKIRLKKNVTLDEPLTFSFNFKYTDRTSMREVLHTSPKIKIKGTADVLAYSHGEYQDRGELTPQEKTNLTASNELKLLSKEPLMIDYRTKEIIWGVSINTVVADRLGLPALTYTDTFGEGLKFDNLSDTDKLLMFRVDVEESKSKASFDQFNKFKKEIKAKLDDPLLKAEELPTVIDELMSEFVDSKDEKTSESENEVEENKTYGEIITRITADNIAHITGNSPSYTNQEYAFSEPKSDPNYVDNLPTDVIFGGENSEIGVVDKTKEELLQGVDFRIDFIESNKDLGTTPDTAGDDRAYYILYKTKLDNDQPMTSVSNKAGIMFADYVSGKDSCIRWVGGDFESKQELGEVAEYNTLPKKVGAQKVVKDTETGRNRLAIAWEITFNYDIDPNSRAAKTLMTVTDTIDKTLPLEAGKQLGNKHLVPEKIEKLKLSAYTVNKDGTLDPSEEHDVVLNKKDNGLELVVSDSDIKYVIEQELNPHYVYKFELNTFIETSDDENNSEASTDISSYALNGSFKNKVGFKRRLIDGGDSEESFAEETVTISNANRIKKAGEWIELSGNVESNQSRQRIDWSLTLNETYESMSDVKIVDTLENQHTFHRVKNEEDIENAVNGKAELKNLKFEEKDPETGDWKETTIDYTLLNSDGEDKSLDDWNTGESGFQLKFNEVITNPIKITYSTYGRAIYKEELPLINKATISYDYNGSSKNHEVQAEVDLPINENAPSNNDEYVDVEFGLRYNDNQPTLHTELNQGIALTGADVDTVRVVLYRYLSNNLNNNFVYRIGVPDTDGKVEFKNIEKGEYVVKQFKAPKGYAVPDSLGFVSEKKVSDDESVEIKNTNKNKLIIVDLKDQGMGSRFASLFASGRDKHDFALYDITPTFTINTKQNLYNNRGTMVSTKLANNEVTVVNQEDATKVYESDENGVIQVGTVNRGDEAIGFGQHKIKQDNQINEGFLKNTKVLTHNIKQNTNGTVSSSSRQIDFNNYKTALNLVVRDKDSQSIIKESAFELYKYEGDNWIKIDDATANGAITDKGYKTVNGTLKLYNLDIGHYKLKQTTVDEYLLNPEELEFYAYGPDTLVKEYEDRPPIMQLEFENIKSNVTIKNTIDGQLIKGSTFNLKDSKDEVIKTFTIDDEETGYTMKLAPGSYSLEQVSTTENRPVNQEPLEFVIDALQRSNRANNSYTYEFINHLGSFEFVTHTHNDETFSVSGFDIKRDTATLVANTQTDLVAGRYALDNVEVDDAWIYVETDYDFVIPNTYLLPEELHQTVDIYATQAQLPFTNLDGDIKAEAPMTDATFKLTHTGTEAEIESGSTRMFTNLIPGVYQLSQTVAPQGYGRNTDVISGITVPEQVSKTEVTLDETQHTVEAYALDEVEYFNYRGRVRLLKKSAETQQPLAGIVFDLYHEDVLVDRYTTNANGLIEVDALSPGNYYFVEISGDGQHLVTNNRVPFTIADTQAGPYETKHLEVLNYYANASFKNINPDQTETYLDAEFTLYKKDNDQWNEVDGYINFGSNPTTQQFEMFGIEAGEYKLTQTKAPSSTIRNTFEYEFEIADTIDESATGRVEIALDDYINYQAQIAINLVDDQGAFTNTVDARLVDSMQRSDEIVQEGATLLLEHLDAKEYTIAIDKAEGAIVVDEQLSFTVPEAAYNDEGLNLEGQARMTYARYKLSLQDGKTHQPLSSGVLTINDQPYSFDEQGDLVLSNLTPQTYRIHQSEAADQYILNTLNTEEFVVFDKISEFAANQINNQDYPYVDFGEKVLFNYQAELVVEKTDENNQPLAGVEFALSNNGNTLNLISDKDGLISASEMAPGHYRLKESKALSGYQALNEIYEFDVVAEYPGEPEVIRLKIINEKLEEIIEDDVITPLDRPNQEDPDQRIPMTGVQTSMVLYSAILVISLFTLVRALNQYKKKHQQ